MSEPYWTPLPPPTPRPKPRSPFARLLREYRDQRRLSQSKLGELANFDHSYVSRMESGGRAPTREAVLSLANAMQLPPTDEDALLSAAGYMPGQMENLFQSEPVIVDAFALLSDTDIPDDIRETARQMIALVIEQADRAATVTADAA